MSVNSKVRSFILSNIVSKNKKKIGIEEECILHTEEGKRLPVNIGAVSYTHLTLPTNREV